MYLKLTETVEEEEMRQSIVKLSLLHNQSANADIPVNLYISILLLHPKDYQPRAK